MSEMTGLMDAIESRMKDKGFETKRKGNYVDVTKFPKSDKKSEATPAPKKSKESGMRTMPIDGGTVTLPKDEPYGLERPFKKGGMVGSASKRADGCCVKGKTRGKIV
jgi:hypothetical protein